MSKATLNPARALNHEIKNHFLHSRNGPKLTETHLKGSSYT